MSATIYRTKNYLCLPDTNNYYQKKSVAHMCTTDFFSFLLSFL